MGKLTTKSRCARGPIAEFLLCHFVTFAGSVDIMSLHGYSHCMASNANPPEGSLTGPFFQRRDKVLQKHQPRPDELSKTNQEEMADRLVNTKRKTRRQTKLAVMGVPSSALERDSQYARCVRLAASYRKVRSRELLVAHGYVSAGASALLSTASLALAASRYLYEKATEARPEDIAGILKHASQLADSARANEIAAWELCAREAVQRKKAEANNAGVPWLTTEKKPGPGRPRKEELSKEEIEGMLSAGGT